MPEINVTYFFYFFAAVIVLSAGSLLFIKNLLYAAVSLVICLLSVAAIFVLSNADFLGVTQIMVYVGGILILMIFGIMLSKKSKGSALNIMSGVHHRMIGFVVVFLVFGGLLWALLRALSPFKVIDEKSFENAESTVNAIGIKLMTSYLLPFELVAVLLLVALIGAIHIAGKKESTN